MSAGKLFEKVSLWLKPLDGMRFTATVLCSLTTLRMLISRSPYIERCSHKTVRLVHSVLYVPRISNLDSGDCFKANGLYDILFAYLEDVRVQVVSKALVFVLPACGELQQKGEQSLHTQKGKQMEGSSCVPVGVRDFKQT